MLCARSMRKVPQSSSLASGAEDASPWVNFIQLSQTMHSMTLQADQGCSTQSTIQQLRGGLTLVPSSEIEYFIVRDGLSSSRVAYLQKRRLDQRQSGYTSDSVYARKAHVADETGFGSLSRQQDSSIV